MFGFLNTTNITDINSWGENEAAEMEGQAANAASSQVSTIISAVVENQVAVASVAAVSAVSATIVTYKVAKKYIFGAKKTEVQADDSAESAPLISEEGSGQDDEQEEPPAEPDGPVVHLEPSSTPQVQAGSRNLPLLKSTTVSSFGTMCSSGDGTGGTHTATDPQPMNGDVHVDGSALRVQSLAPIPQVQAQHVAMTNASSNSNLPLLKSATVSSFGTMSSSRCGGIAGETKVEPKGEVHVAESPQSVPMTLPIANFATMSSADVVPKAEPEKRDPPEQPNTEKVSDPAVEPQGEVHVAESPQSVPMTLPIANFATMSSAGVVPNAAEPEKRDPPEQPNTEKVSDPAEKAQVEPEPPTAENQPIIESAVASTPVEATLTTKPEDVPPQPPAAAVKSTEAEEGEEESEEEVTEETIETTQLKKRVVQTEEVVEEEVTESEEEEEEVGSATTSGVAHGHQHGRGHHRGRGHAKGLLGHAIDLGKHLQDRDKHGGGGEHEHDDGHHGRRRSAHPHGDGGGDGGDGPGHYHDHGGGGRGRGLGRGHHR